MKRKKFSLAVFLLVLAVSLMAGCRKKNEPAEAGAEEGYQIYYINKEATGVATVSYEPHGSTTQALLAEFLTLLQTSPQEGEYKPAIPGSVKLESYEMEGTQLFLHFDLAYLEMDKLYEILCRSALVRTLCQIPDVEYVSFYVDDKALLDSNGTPVGALSADSFVENPGDEINTYTSARLELYFTNKTGDKLVAEKVNVRYSSNMSMEKLVVEQLIKGPITKEAYPTIPQETKIVSVSAKDGICYVNLDKGFLSQGYDVLEAIPIYSIVNSLTEIPGISRVQILINGETNLVFRESIRFETIFERNLDLVEVPGEKEAEEKPKEAS